RRRRGGRRRDHPRDPGRTEPGVRMSGRRGTGVSLAVALLLGLGAATTACADAGARRYSRREAAAGMARLGLELGRFRLAPEPVLDGDTIKVDGLDASLRLLAIDTEETPKSKAAGRAVAEDFE